MLFRRSVVGLISCILLSSAAFADSYYFRAKGKIGIETPASLEISGTPPLIAVEGESYVAAFTASGGASLTYSVSGPLPGWLSFNPSNGTLSGTPTTNDVGMVGPITVSVTAAGGNTVASQPFTFEVLPTLLAPQGAYVAAAPFNAPYSSQPLSSGNVNAVAWNVASGVLPEGLNLNADGTISGNATAPAGKYQFTVTYDDAHGRTSPPSNTQTISVQVGLLAWWTFDAATMDFAANKAMDSSGRGNALTLSGMTPTNAVGGVSGQALNFVCQNPCNEQGGPATGWTTQKASGGNIPTFNFGSGDFTVSFRVKLAAPWGEPISSHGIAGQKTGDGSFGWQIYQNTTKPGKIAIRLGLQNDFFTNSTMPIGSWVTGTVVRSGTTVQWYINGALDATGTNSTVLTDTAPFNVGYAQTWKGYLSGALDDLRVYDRALTPTEVSDLAAGNM